MNLCDAGLLIEHFSITITGTSTLADLDLRNRASSYTLDIEQKLHRDFKDYENS